jgi:hypothetical protein
MIYVGNVNLLHKNINMRRTKTLLGASKDADLELNAEETMYMFLSWQHNTGHNYNIRISKKSFGNMAILSACQ